MFIVAPAFVHIILHELQETFGPLRMRPAQDGEPRLRGRELTHRLVTLGTPYRGSIEALVRLSNGFDPKLGPFKIKQYGKAILAAMGKDSR